LTAADRGVPSRRERHDAIMNEGDMTPEYEGKLRNQQLAVGVADVQDLNVESPETLVQRVEEWAGSWPRASRC
jgi:hypothetical protein